MTKQVNELTAIELWHELNDKGTNLTRFQELQDEYFARCNNYTHDISSMEYHYELIWPVGFLSGVELEVPLPCQSLYHVGESGHTLPYVFRDGTRRMVCKNCMVKEHNHYNLIYGVIDS